MTPPAPITPRTPSADAVASALVDTWVLLCGAIEGGWSRTADGVTTAVSGIAAAPFNGVWVTAAKEVRTETVEFALDQVTATGLPHLLLVRPGVTEVAVPLADRRNMTLELPTPLMCAAPPPRPRPVDGLTVRARHLGRRGCDCELAAEGFGMPLELFAALISPGMLALPGFRLYVGEVSGQPVVTAAALTRGPWVGALRGHGGRVPSPRDTGRRSPRTLPRTRPPTAPSGRGCSPARPGTASTAGSDSSCSSAGPPGPGTPAG